MKKYLIIAPLGGEPDAIFLGVREFPTKRVLLIADDDDLRDADRIKTDLERFKIPATIQRIKGPLWEELFRIVHETTEAVNGTLEPILNVSSGRCMTNCAATSAAFVNGIKAFSMNNKGELVVLPVLKFSYHTLLSDRKMKLLSLLSGDDCCASLDELGRKAKMSLSLVSYHINGNLKSKGLKQLGLVETKNVGGRMHVEPTTLGRLLLNGYI